jgi:hypothetical protein
LERSNSTLKTYTHQQAVCQGHPFRWTSEDLDKARQLANTISRPWGHEGPTPEEAWQQRTLITDQEREQFQTTFQAQRIEAAADLGMDIRGSLSVSQRARLDRLALSRTLQQLEYLTKTRVDRPPKKPKRLSRAELARRVAKDRRDKAKSDTDNALAGTDPAASSHTVDGTKASIASPSPPIDTGSSLTDSHCAIALLASTEEVATIQSLVTQGLPAGKPCSPPTTLMPAQRERTILSWLGRPITLLISLLKAANIFW